MHKISAKDIDQHLPQTQCGLCEYAGCMPYANAIAKGEASIDRCLPGGVPVLKKLGEFLSIDVVPFISEMEKKQKAPCVARIDESLCIGCVKCIKVCPVDAIIGSAKWMHTVLTDACTGCELCIPACPMDCIAMLPIPTPADPKLVANKAREHFHRRQRRLNIHIVEEKTFYEVNTYAKSEEVQDPKKAYIQAALLRAQAKRASK